MYNYEPMTHVRFRCTIAMSNYKLNLQNKKITTLIRNNQWLTIHTNIQIYCYHVRKCIWYNFIILLCYRIITLLYIFFLEISIILILKSFFKCESKAIAVFSITLWFILISFYAICVQKLHWKSIILTLTRVF